MAKPIQMNVPAVNTKLPSEAAQAERAVPSSIDSTGPRTGFSRAPSPSQANISSAVRQAQERQANNYRTVEGDLDAASRCLSVFRASANSPHPNFGLLAEARTHLDAAGEHYRQAFSVSSGTVMIREGSTINTYDIGTLNTRLNAIELAYRRASQVAESLR